MRVALLLYAAALAAQTRDIPFDGGNLLRVDSKADLVAGDRYVEIKRGKVVYGIADQNAPLVDIGTPGGIAHPYLPGEYKIEVKSSGETSITPLGGDVRVTTQRGDEWVHVGRKLIVRGANVRNISALSGWRWIATLLQNVQFSANAGDDSDSSQPASGGGTHTPRAQSQDRAPGPRGNVGGPKSDSPAPRGK